MANRNLPEWPPPQGTPDRDRPQDDKKGTRNDQKKEDAEQTGTTEPHPELLKELLDDLEEVNSEWYNFGLQLPHMKPHQLKAIEKDNIKLGVSDCFRAMLDKWLDNTKEGPDAIWIHVCKALKKLPNIRLADKIAQKHGISPRIVEHPQNQCAELGGTVTFRCEASTSAHEFQITYKWLLSHDGRDSEVIQKGKPASAELTITKVTEEQRGKYKCIVKNEFGEEKSQSAKLMIGKMLEPDGLREILNEEGIEDTAWPEIGKCLGQDLRRTFVGGICMRIEECPFDKEDLWHKIAQALEAQGMETAAQKAKRNAGRKLDVITVNGLFKEVGIENPDWCKIDEELRRPATVQQHKQHWESFDEEKQPNTEHAHEGSERCSVATILEHKNITWEKLAKALERIRLQGYQRAAVKINTECREVETDRDRLDAVFTDASQVNWLQVVEDFPNFNTSCFMEVLTKWLSQQKDKDPWIVWRSLAASVESLKDGSKNPKEVKCQLGIGYKLRLRLGVGLEINVKNFIKFLKKAGIKDLNIIVPGLLEPHWIKRLVQTFTDWFRSQETIIAEFLDKWPTPHSWEELARVCEDLKDLKSQKTGPEIAQMTRKLSGSGGFPAINFLFSDPELKNVKSDTTVTLKCEARGAPPLRYTWTCDDVNLPSNPPHSWSMKLKVKRGGRQYNCRVENDFGYCLSEHPLQLVCGDAPTCKFDDQQKRNIRTGHNLYLHCTAGGSKPLKYTWLHDGKVLHDKNEPDLEIIQVKPDDAGKYECRVENDFDKDSSTIKIKVGEPPQIKSFGLEEPEKVHYESGVTLNFYCEATSTGKATYTWQRFRGNVNTEVGRGKNLRVTTRKNTQGKYTCQVENEFGATTSSSKEIKVGDKPTVEDRPKIAGKVIPGERVQLTCAVEGNEPFEYVWIHDNQTLVKKAGSCVTEAELSIEPMTAADQGEYKCRFINSYGFCVSEPVLLELGIEVKELMEQLCTPLISHRWYMFGILLGVKKSTLVKIVRGFATSANVRYSLQEVIESWLEMKHNPQRPHSLATIQDVVQRMGNEALARDLGSQTKTTSLTQEIAEEPTETASLSQKKTDECAKYNAKFMHRQFEVLAGKVEKMLTNPDFSDTESGSTRRDPDAVVSGIRAWLHLIGFQEKDIQQSTNLHSVIEILRQYLNYQRYHLLEKVIFQFCDKKAQDEMKEFIDQFSEYQATTSLGNFVPSKQHPNDGHLTSEGDPPDIAAKKPAFMNSFKIVLESKWATCTLMDAENLLVNLLPDTVSREFVWFSKADRAEENSVCLEYLVSPAVIELLGNEMETRKQTLSSMGIHCVHVDSKIFKTASSIIGAHTEEQGANPPGIQLLMNQLALELREDAQKTESKQDAEIDGLWKGLEDTSAKQDSEIKTLSKALEETCTKQDSEIEALRKALEDTSTKLDSEIEALRKALEDTSTKQDSEFEALRKELEETNTKQDSENEALRKELEETNTKQDSEFEALRQELEETNTKQDSEFEALRKELEDTRTALEDTMSAHDQEIKFLQEKIDALKKTTTAVHQRDKGLLKAEIRSNKEELKKKMTDHVASLESAIDTKARHGIRKQFNPPTRSSRGSVSNPTEKESAGSTGAQTGEITTRPLLESVSSPTEKASPGSTGAQTGENAAENGQSQDQGQTQESLDAASLFKQLQEMFKAQQQHMESYIARKFEEHDVKPKEKH